MKIVQEKVSLFFNSILFLILLLSASWITVVFRVTSFNYLLSLILTLTTLMIIQGIFTIFWMLYTWNDESSFRQSSSPTRFYPSLLSFTALVPARHEQAVIADTLLSIASINYPKHQTEILVICRSDDQETIMAAQNAIEKYQLSQARVIVFDDQPVNKPHGLNIGLNYATKDVVAVFDAEDEPSKNIYQVINTVMCKDRADVVQAGVQLMNYQSNWFSAMNVLEYFFWFKSALHYFAQVGVVPLGGNTVFFRKKWLQDAGGWSENCLTEDAEIGIRLSIAGAKIKIVYDEKIVTQEETPPSVTSFLKQRSRWIQGFLQILFNGDWLLLSNLKQKMLTFYLLASPFFQMIWVIYLPVSFLMLFLAKISIWWAMFTFVPLYLLVLQLVINVLGMWVFTRSYQLHFSWLSPIRILLSFFPFQILLGLASFRAAKRLISKEMTWEKTEHLNSHRTMFVVEAGVR